MGRTRATSRPYTTAGTSRSWRSCSSRRRSSSSWLLLPLSTARPFLPASLAAGALAVLPRLRRARGRLQRDEGRRTPSSGSGSSRCWRRLGRPRCCGDPAGRRRLRVRGPTKVVVEEEPGVFERIAISFAARRGGGCPPGPGRDFLRTLPRRVRALRPAHPRDVGSHGRALGDAGRDLRVRSERTARAPGYLARVLVPNCDLLWRALRHADVRSRSLAAFRRHKLPPGPGALFSRSLAVLPRPRLEILRGLPHLGRVERLTEPPAAFPIVSGSVAPLVRSTLQGLGDLGEVVRHDAVVVPDLPRGPGRRSRRRSPRRPRRDRPPPLSDWPSSPRYLRTWHSSDRSPRSSSSDVPVMSSVVSSFESSPLVSVTTAASVASPPASSESSPRNRPRRAREPRSGAPSAFVRSRASSLHRGGAGRSLHRNNGMLFGVAERTREERDALDVRRVREHVDRRAADEPRSRTRPGARRDRRQASWDCRRRRRSARPRGRPSA